MSCTIYVVRSSRSTSPTSPSTWSWRTNYTCLEVQHKINQPVWPTLITLLVSLFRSKHIHAYIRVFKINSFYKFPSGIILQNQILDPMYNQISFFNNNAWYSFIQRKMIRSSVIATLICSTMAMNYFNLKMLTKFKLNTENYFSQLMWWCLVNRSSIQIVHKSIFIG